MLPRPEADPGPLRYQIATKLHLFLACLERSITTAFSLNATTKSRSPSSFLSKSMSLFVIGVVPSRLTTSDRMRWLQFLQKSIIAAPGSAHDLLVSWGNEGSGLQPRRGTVNPLPAFLKRIIFCGVCCACGFRLAAQVPGLDSDTVSVAPPAEVDRFTFRNVLKGRGAGTSDPLGSTYIPMDSWVYPAMTRLYSMGYGGTLFLGMRPWTRRSLLHVLESTQDEIVRSSDDEAGAILLALLRELRAEAPMGGPRQENLLGVESVYTRVMGIAGTTLRDSYHLGQTVVNDYGRPYEPGFNNLTGFSALGERGRLSFYVRGEYLHAPAAAGYSNALANTLSELDLQLPYQAPNAPQSTIPAGPISAANPFRLVEATVSLHLLGHEISGGKSDAWLGPAQGGAMAWSNNAENIYSVRVNRVEPLSIPLLSTLLGPVRYDFFYGSLKGHTDPNSPYVHSEMFSFRPTQNFEFGFQRTVIFGGHGHEAVTLRTFARSFFSLSDTEANLQSKYGSQDPGARFSDFNFSYRLPFLRRYATLYVDSITHDDVTPASAPRRAAYRPGVEISQLPGMRKLELRVEGMDTNQPVSRSTGGYFTYWELEQKQGYTNKGFLLGDWIGRQGTGEQAWLTYHLSGEEWVQMEYIHKKNARDFIDQGTTQNSLKVSMLKRLRPDLQLDASMQLERWKAPIYLPGARNNAVGTFQFTYFPGLH